MSLCSYVEDGLLALGLKSDDFSVEVQTHISPQSEGHHVIFATGLPEDCIFAREVGMP